MRITIIILLITIFILLQSSIPPRYEAYVKEHLLTAQMLEQAYGIPVSIQFAQAIQESGAGRSNIAKESKNHFGIRCGDNWKLDRYYCSSGCWRKYPTVQASWVDHARYIANYYPNAMHKNWQFYGKLEGYGEAGYWSKIVRIVKKYKLYQYDTAYSCN